MIETILASTITPWLVGLFGVSIGGGILKWILGKVPVDEIKKAFGGFMFWVGKVCTLNISKWPYVGKYWNSCIEPWFIVFLQGLVAFGLSEFVRGLKTDNSNGNVIENKFVIGAITENPNKTIDVAFAPDNKTWITVPNQFKNPEIGDVLEIIPPQVINLIKKS